MNYLAHHEVARRYIEKQRSQKDEFWTGIDQSQELAFLFGSFATDLARMGGVKMKDPPIEDEFVALGVSFHIETNRAFDSQERIISFKSDLGRAISDSGLFDRPTQAKQCVNAGIDIMFDGPRVADSMTMFGFWRTMSEACNINSAGLSKDEAKLGQVVDYLLENGTPRYDEPDQVATRIHRTLNNTRARFDEDMIPALTEVITDFAPNIKKLSGPAIQDTIDTLLKLPINVPVKNE